MGGLFRDIIMIAAGMNLTMFAGGALLGSSDLMILSVLNLTLLMVGVTIKDMLNKDD